MKEHSVLVLERDDRRPEAARRVGSDGSFHRSPVGLPDAPMAMPKQRLERRSGMLARLWLNVFGGTPSRRVGH